MSKDTVKTQTVDKETPPQRKDLFRCKKCNAWKKQTDARPIIVTQRNRPMEFEHITFSSKAEVMICKECFQTLKRA